MLRTLARLRPSPFLARTRTRTFATEPRMDRYLADVDPPVCSLNIKPAFDALTQEESESCFAPRCCGWLVCLGGSVGWDRGRS